MAKRERTVDYLTILAQFGWIESEDLEFKSARGGLPLSMWETYSAMANTKGGVILLGVENDGTVTGLTDLEKIKKSFWDTINNRSKISANILENDDVKEVDHPNGTVLAIHIPRATRHQRPIFTGQNPLTCTYRRNYEGDYRCTEQEVGRMLSDRAEIPVDSRILTHYNLYDLDLISLQQYRQRFRSFKPTHPWLNEDDKGLLSKLGGWDTCKETKQESLTVAGLLMFGKEGALRKALPQYSVDYREKLSDDPDIRWTDRLTLDGTWEGNLFQFYIRVVQKVSADLKLPFQLDSNLFRKGETVVHEAIREALVNALIHADHFGQGGVIIEKYKDRFEFSNQGSLLITMEQLLHGNVSECRNKALQLMFTMMGAAEKAGSGIDKIRRGWSSQHWRSPIVRERTQPDRILWVLPMMSLIPDESLNRLKQQFGSKLQSFTSLEIQALVTADLEGCVDNSRMRQITSEHPADITKLLQKLVSKGILVQDGSGRWARYQLCSKSNPMHKNPSLSHKNPSLSHKNPSLSHRSQPSDNEWDELVKIALPAKVNKRLTHKEAELAVLALCKNYWLTKNQIGELLGRNPIGLRVRILNSMLENGLLRMRYPEKPKHGDQAYTSNANVDQSITSNPESAEPEESL